jgi:hypothetical protein
MNARNFFLASVCLYSAAMLPLPAQFLQSDSDERLKQWVEFLADDALEGRLTGSKGEQRALEFLSEQFQSWALTPMNAEQFSQSFEFTWEILPEASAALEWEWNGTRRPLNAWPISGCGEAVLPGTEVLDLGYGIEDQSNGHNDYAAFSDLGGKIVVIQPGTPSSSNPHADFSRWTLLERARLAAQRGASAVVFMGGSADDEPSKTIDPHVHALPIPVWYSKARLDLK